MPPLSATWINDFISNKWVHSIESKPFTQTNQKVYPSVDCRDVVPHCWWRRDPSFRELGCLSSFGLHFLISKNIVHTINAQIHSSGGQIVSWRPRRARPPLQGRDRRQVKRTRPNSPHCFEINMQISLFSQTINQGNSVAGGEPNDQCVSSKSPSDGRQHWFDHHCCHIWKRKHKSNMFRGFPQSIRADKQSARMNHE